MLKPEERKAIVVDLVTNCDCWKNVGDAELLNNFPDEKLVSLKKELERNRQMAIVANAAVNGHVEGGRAFRVNPETGRWETAEVQNSGKSGEPRNAEKKEEEDEDAAYRDKEYRKRMAGKGATMNSESTPAPQERRPVTADEWFRQAPADVQNRLNYLQQIEQREKEKVISNLLVNVGDQMEKRAQFERLIKFSLDDLQNMLSLMPKVPTQEEVDRATKPRHPVPGQQRRQPAEEDILNTPTWNWSEVGENNRKTERQAAQPVTNEYDSIDPSDQEDWLLNAPPHIRRQFHEAAAITEQERRRLIKELTANLEDDDSRKRLELRCQDKSVEELKDLQILSQRQERRGSYFGSSIPLGNNRGQQGTDAGDDDILPLPKHDWKEISGSGKRNQA